MVERLEGDRGKLLVGSLMLSVVKGQEFKIPSVCAISIANDSSSSDLLSLHQRRQDGVG